MVFFLVYLQIGGGNGQGQEENHSPHDLKARKAISREGTRFQAAFPTHANYDPVESSFGLKSAVKKAVVVDQTKG